ncbi:hypothetical protein [Roseivirga sp. E12]|uniref:hypothetical protein n=1 Tax=Roseivirga sp. E12 TaxID=2819237 RepID=UPI001ABCD48C|nr:hypothetical protein [Roseivirga sp. E12]MBO3700158.1 hypothetical protein [Roseivirga sp. E12]
MKSNTVLLIIGALTILSSACDNISNEIAEEQVVDSFEFPISSHDNMGMIELPEIVFGEKVTNIEVINTPQGQYEILTQTFTTLLERGENFHYIIYTAPDANTTEDELLIEMTTTSGTKTRVLARVSDVKDGLCTNNDGGYNFGLRNFTFNVRAGQTIEIPDIENRYLIDGIRTPIPCLYENSDYAGPVYGQIKLHPIGENLIQVPNGRCCTFLGSDDDVFITRKSDDGMGPFDPTVDKVGHWNWIFKIPLGKTGTFRFINRVGRYKTDVNGKLTNSEIGSGTFPNYTGDWESMFLWHSYNIITFHVTE